MEAASVQAPLGSEVTATIGFDQIPDDASNEPST
jgi:hypothetical protein